MRYYLIAGEASGDLHGSNLLRALRQEDPHAEFRAWGGDLMEAQGAELVKHYRDLAFMGFWEVVTHLGTILSNFRLCKRDILHYQPDVLILIDYPGFNLRMARWAAARGIRVFYYISPQLWAWHSSRVRQIKQSVERLYVILPFEPDFYARYQYEVDYVGHPLLDVVENFQAPDNFREQHQLDDRPIIALLPGSRKQEIRRMLAGMLALSSDFPEYQFVVAGAPSQPEDFYRQFLANYPGVKLIPNQTYALLSMASAALVTSGTATLETALFRVPQVVCYRGSALSYSIARNLIQVPYISLVNLIMNKPLVTELIQHEFRRERLREELQKLLHPEFATQLKQGYEELHQTLGGSGASARAAKLMVQRLFEL
jgi:lipid-A-disaccharide synthase